MIGLFHIVLLLALGLPITYLAFLSLLACTVRKAPSRVPDRNRRFAIVVPAHNEELSLQATVQSLRGLSYPPSLYDVVVIADIADRTAEIARAGESWAERTSAGERGRMPAVGVIDCCRVL
jgi:cellulose synthase/poly-beta-1,6-N-acetylglucosamine synthase-like glycosyltransferase